MMVLKSRVCLSFRSSFHLYVSFLGTDSLFFSETQHAVRGPSIVICDSWIFWKTSLLGKSGQKYPKTGFWDFLIKSCHQFCLEFVSNEVLKVHQYSAKTASLGKTWFSSYSQKWLAANELSVFFNLQYFTNRLIFHFHFWHVDRHK